MRALHHALAALLFWCAGVASRPVNVLVFGDSQGDTGPTYRVVADQFAKHNITHNVSSVAVGGTLSCGWNKDPDAIAKAAQAHFGGSGGPDLVWFTAGGNDLAGDAEYHKCLDSANHHTQAVSCLRAANARLLPCTVSLLNGLWKAFPEAKVGMYNYEVSCMENECLSAAEQFLGGSYCARQAESVSCVIEQLEYWQTIYVDALQAKFPRPRFTGMNVLGASQEASGVAFASVGHPVVTAGSRCDWMVACVHPKYGTPTATAIGVAMWDLWLHHVTTTTTTTTTTTGSEEKAVD